MSFVDRLGDDGDAPVKVLDLPGGDNADDEDGDEDTVRALLEALDYVADGGVYIDRAWDPGKHPRDPKGRFRSVVNRIIDALEAWADGTGPDDPLDGFDREQLRLAAKARGIPLRRGAPRGEIADALLDDVRKTRKAKKAAAKAVPDGLDTMSDRDLRDWAAEHEIPNFSTKSREQLLRDLRAVGARKPPADPTPFRKELDDTLFTIGRRKPVRVGPFDDAAQALAEGDDRKSVALGLRRAAAADKTMTPEDLKTYQLLAAEIRKTKPRPLWLTDNHTIILDELIKEQGPDVKLHLLADQARRDWLDGKTPRPDGARPWTTRFEAVRQDLMQGKLTQRKAVGELRQQADSIDRVVRNLKKEKDGWLAGSWPYKPTLTDEENLAAGPTMGPAYRELADFLEQVKVPPKPRQRSLGSTELGEVLPIDETRFRRADFHYATTARGQALDPTFRHQGVFLFAPGYHRPERAGLTKAENGALDYYTVGRLARALNGSLRKGRNHHGEVSFPEIGLTQKIDLDEVRQHLDSAIEHSELGRDSVLWRGVLLKTADRNRLVPGAILSDPGYTSTTTLERDADKVIDNWRQAGLYKGTKPAKFKIYAQGGTHGAVGHAGVHEILLARDQKFRVIREDPPGPDGVPTFVVEAVAPETGSGLVRGRHMLDTFDYDNLPKSTNIYTAGRVDQVELQRRIYQAQGFDGLPKTATKAEMDEAVRRGAVEMFRGLNGSVAGSYADQFRTGDLYYGTGGAVYGRGTYATPDQVFARTYAGGSRGVVLRMALRRDARVIHYEDLRKLHLKAMPKLLRELDEQQRVELDGVDRNDTTKIQAILNKYAGLRAKSSKRSQAISDLGLFAALSGYDAIVVPINYRGGKGRGQPTEYVITNRTALLVEEAS